MNAAIDAILFLLLISAAVTGLYAAHHSAISNSATQVADADAVANSLATTTVAIKHDRAEAFDHIDPVPVVHERTLAGHIAHATILTARLDRELLTPDARPYRVAVRETVRGRTGGFVRIDGRWRVARNLRATFSIGPRPPSSGTKREISTARVDVVLAVAADTNKTESPVAARAVGILLPPTIHTTQLRTEDGRRAVTATQYRHIAGILDADINSSVQAENITAANAALTEHLDSRIESPVFPSRISTVEIVVRRWRRR
jgi:hypothetical protein